MGHVTSLLRLRVEPSDWRALPRPSRHLDFSHSQTVTSAIINLCMETNFKGVGVQIHNGGKNNPASDPLHTRLVIVVTGALHLYSESSSGRNVSLPFYYVMVQTEFHQGFDVSVKFFEM